MFLFQVKMVRCVVSSWESTTRQQLSALGRIDFPKKLFR
jgi:hypothetical protein